MNKQLKKRKFASPKPDMSPLGDRPFYAIGIKAEVRDATRGRTLALRREARVRSGVL